MSLIRLTGRTVAKVVGLILGYFVLAGPYYTILDELFTVCTDTGGAALLTFIAWAYPVAYYGYPSVVTFGIIWTIYCFYAELREKDYATEEVYYYGP